MNRSLITSSQQSCNRPLSRDTWDQDLHLLDCGDRHHLTSVSALRLKQVSRFDVPVAFNSALLDHLSEQDAWYHPDEKCAWSAITVWTHGVRVIVGGYN